MKVQSNVRQHRSVRTAAAIIIVGENDIQFLHMLCTMTRDLFIKEYEINFARYFVWQEMNLHILLRITTTFLCQFFFITFFLFLLILKLYVHLGIHQVFCSSTLNSKVSTFACILCSMWDSFRCNIFRRRYVPKFHL